MFSALAAPHGLIASALFSTANLCQSPPQIVVSCASRQAHQRPAHHLLRGIAEDSFRTPVPAHHPALQGGAHNRIVRRAYDGGEQPQRFVLRCRNCDICRSTGDVRKCCSIIEHSSAAFPSFESSTGRPSRCPALAHRCEHLLCRRLSTLIANDRSAHSASASISGTERSATSQKTIPRATVAPASAAIIPGEAA